MLGQELRFTSVANAGSCTSERIHQVYWKSTIFRNDMKLRSIGNTQLQKTKKVAKLLTECRLGKIACTKRLHDFYIEKTWIIYNSDVCILILQ